MGDIIQRIHVTAALARQLPECRITWLVRDRFAPVTRIFASVHDTIPWSREAGLRGFFDVWRALRRRRFDVVWNMHGMLRDSTMALFARAPEKWMQRSRRWPQRHFGFRQLEIPAALHDAHVVTRQQIYLQALGLSTAIPHPLELRPGPVFDWQPFFSGDPLRTFVICTDSSKPAKNWPGFEALTHLILERIPESRVAWCAGRQTALLRPPPAGRFLNLTGVSLEETVALIRQPSVFIGNDTGPTHLAGAVGNRVLALFGPTSPRRYAPWPVGGPRSQVLVAPDRRLERLDPETVFAALDELRHRG
ncbi:glycosyl transferase family 9 [Opitutaceae bacterium TAV5]|nr:glycosyl transferase family 9 [Opitutaceae bacterium TAV5]